MGKFDGTVALITGAARGQGRSHAIRLASEGADIIATDICEQIDSVGYPLGTSADLDETVRLVELEGRRIVASKADVRDPAAMAAAVQRGVTELGRIDIILANAGICSVFSAEEMPTQAWHDVLDVNLNGVFHTVQAALPHVVAGGRGGSIIITSSCTSLRVVKNLTHYIAAKSGLDGYMRALALELAPQFIRVNTLHPTNVDTGMIQNEHMRRLFLPDEAEPTREMSEPVYATLSAMPIPWVQPEDISNAVSFLASSEAKFITGASLPVDAGFALL